MGVHPAKTFAMGYVLANVLMGVAIEDSIGLFAVKSQKDEVMSPYCQFKEACQGERWGDPSTVHAQFVAPEGSTENTTEKLAATPRGGLLA